MFQVIDCIVVDHDLRFVAIAAIISVFGSFAALNLLFRAGGQDGSARLLWLTAAAVVGGGGIWATHFVAMLGYRTAAPVIYELRLTVVSIGLAVAFTWVGFLLALRGGGWAAVGGIIAGLAIALMHFTGMYAIRGPVHLVWSPGFVASSVALAAAGCSAALWTASRYGRILRHRIGATALYVAGIVALHFTAMTGLTLAPDPSAGLPAQVVAPGSLAILVVAVTAAIIGIGLIGSFVDQHLAERSVREAERLRVYVEELEETRRRLEDTTDTLRVALDQAAASSQAKSQFLAAMSHELRTPLNAVIGFSQMISEEMYGPVGNPQYAEFAKIVTSSGSHLLSLINDILDLSSLDAGALQLQEESADLSALAHEALQMVAAQARADGIALHILLPPDLPPMFVDRRRVRQVILNLLSNAVKFTPPGGEVSVTAARTDDGVSILVADTGIGIAPEDLPRALERFGQVDNSLSRQYEGTGLGLPLSRDLVELHGGSLVIASVAGAGTTVTVTLPESRIAESRRVA